MSYRIQIDVYGDRDKNRENTEKEERKNDRWMKRIVFAFLALMFIFYTKELFTTVMMDGSKVKIKHQGDSTEYILRTSTIRVKGQKDQAAEALVTLNYDNMPSDSYTLSFSNPKDWEHSTVTIINKKGVEVSKEQYNGFHASMAKSSDQSGILSATNKYKSLAALAFREATKAKVNRLIYGVVCLLYLAEFISFKLWEWVFYRYKITWAVARGNLPSHAYKQTLLIGRFIVFLLILYISALSYVV